MSDTGLDFVQDHLHDRAVVDTFSISIGSLRVVALLASDGTMPSPDVMALWDEAKCVLLDAEREDQMERTVAAYRSLPRRKRWLVDQLVEELR